MWKVFVILMPQSSFPPPVNLKLEELILQRQNALHAKIPHGFSKKPGVFTVFMKIPGFQKVFTEFLQKARFSQGFS